MITIGILILIGLDRMMVMISDDVSGSMIINDRQCYLQWPVSVP